MLRPNYTHTMSLAESRDHRGSTRRAPWGAPWGATWGATWGNWLGTGLRLLVRDTRALADLLATWQQRASMRHQLRALDDRFLKDIGLSRADAEREGGKSFWRA